MIIPYFILATEVSSGEINEYELQINENAANPRDIKRKLAREIVTLYYSREKAEEAEKDFDRVLKKRCSH